MLIWLIRLVLLCLLDFLILWGFVIEGILAEISDADERPAARLRYRSGGNLAEKYPPLFLICARPIFPSKKEEDIFLLGSALQVFGRSGGVSALGRGGIPPTPPFRRALA